MITPASPPSPRRAPGPITLSPSVPAWRRRWLPALVSAAFAAAPVWAADGGFELGTVVVTGRPVPPSASGEAVVSAAQMASGNRDTVADAVAMLPGVSLSKNSRNEDMVYVRGFDARQVPVFVDGIPLYVPYDGYVDFGRFTTFDLAEIRVARSDASLLYGPNTLGGAINLVTRKPVKPLEGDIRIGIGSGDLSKVAVNLGSNQESWYLQLGASYLDANSFPLPHGFKDRKAVPTDTGDKRENAYRTDTRASFKLGFTPNATDEYAIGYVTQDGEKGNPVYTGDSNSGIRYWRWPYWDKDSLYFISNTRLGDNILKTRLYEDRYKNGLYAYSDSTYSTELVNRNFPSYYDDRVRGASVELTSYLLRDHELRVAAHYKEDKHQDSNPLSPTKNYRDVTTSLAIEDTVTLAPAWRLRLGASHDRRDAKEVYQWPTGSTSATNGLIELSHILDDSGSELYALASHKTRFPTIKDRYSARMGAALPNPDLKPETANHGEIGVKGTPWDGGRGQLAVFYSHIQDLMQSVIVPAPTGTCGKNSKTCPQMQNVGRARTAGVELSIEQQLPANWSVGGAYTYLARRNLSDPATLPTDTPRHRLFAHVSWAPANEWVFNATAEAEQGRKVAYAGANGSTFRSLAGYATFGLNGEWTPRKDMSLQLGMNNIGDKWYELADGYPMPGRTWYANATYRF